MTRYRKSDAGGPLLVCYRTIIEGVDQPLLQEPTYLPCIWSCGYNLVMAGGGLMGLPYVGHVIGRALDALKELIQ